MLIKLENGTVTDTKQIAELQEELKVAHHNESVANSRYNEATDKLHRRNMQIAELKNKIEKMNNTIDAIATGKIGR